MKAAVNGRRNTGTDSSPWLANLLRAHDAQMNLGPL
jgi:hypothetical protein